jgi:hypothetical protein
VIEPVSSEITKYPAPKTRNDSATLPFTLTIFPSYLEGDLVMSAIFSVHPKRLLQETNESRKRTIKDNLVKCTFIPPHWYP